MPDLRLPCSAAEYGHSALHVVMSLPADRPLEPIVGRHSGDRERIFSNELDSADLNLLPHFGLSLSEWLIRCITLPRRRSDNDPSAILTQRPSFRCRDLHWWQRPHGGFTLTSRQTAGHLRGIIAVPTRMDTPSTLQLKGLHGNSGK
jgi:hypothetical protein